MAVHRYVKEAGAGLREQEDTGLLLGDPLSQPPRSSVDVASPPPDPPDLALPLEDLPPPDLALPLDEQPPLELGLRLGDLSPPDEPATPAPASPEPASPEPANPEPAPLSLQGLLDGATETTPAPEPTSPWSEAVEEWGEDRRGAPATIAAEAWTPPTGLFRRACEAMWIAWQPIVNAPAQALHGFEALLRTEDPMLSRPRLLVEAAGRIGRLHELGRRARNLVAESAQDAPEGALLYVNLHPRELLDDQLCAGEDQLAAFAHKCVLEITERVSLDDIPEARSRIQQLRLIGYHIAVGSIGSGYAGLASIAELEPDVIKLDRALIRNLQNEPVRRRLVGGLLAAAKDLGMSAVAEGVELATERDVLIELGCDLMQGFLFGRPVKGFAEPVW
jgi:EAL domain-containing protein (putative c-di-GMP-specific phosphodiesterase class I)